MAWWSLSSLLYYAEEVCRRGEAVMVIGSQQPAGASNTQPVLVPHREAKTPEGL